MTREEAKKEFWEKNGVFEKALAINYEKVIKSYFVGSEFDNFIDKIFDEFENRTCKKRNDFVYVVIEELGDERTDVKYFFNTLNEAQRYLEKIVEERGDVYHMYDDMVEFANDDVYYIAKAIKYE